MKLNAVATQVACGSKLGQVDESIERLKALQGELLSAANDLLIRLGPVLSPYGGDSAEGQPPTPVRAPLADTIHSCADTAYVVLLNLRDIQSRLEV